MITRFRRKRFNLKIFTYGNLTGLAIGLLASFTANLFTGRNCLIQALTGFPCPGCGMTRAGLLVLSFNFEAAFYMHHLWLFIPVLLLAAILFEIRPSIIKSKLFIGAFGVMIAAFMGLYVARMIMYYPAVEPMVYHERSLLGWIHRLIAGRANPPA